MPTKPTHLRIPDEEKAAWLERAAAAGMNLTEWIRAKCNGTPEAGGTSGPTRQKRREPSFPPTVAESLGPKRVREAEAAGEVKPENRVFNGHEVDCDCMRCTQSRRFYKNLAKAAAPEKKGKR